MSREYVIHPCTVEMIKGKAYFEECTETADDIACWSVYESIGGILLWQSDHISKNEAIVERDRLTNQTEKE
jgi:hypothetical protein